MAVKAMFQGSAPKTKNARDIAATVLPVKLSDGSFAYNVMLTVGDASIVFAAEDVHHASRLRDEINGCAWVERVA